MALDLSQFKSKKIALVLSGGMVKAGAWHMGVAQALEELGFVFQHNSSPEFPDAPEISTYVGSSAGALINLYLASGFTPEQVIQGSSAQKKVGNFQRIGHKDIFCLKKSIKKPKQVKKVGLFNEFPLILKLILSPLLKVSGLFSTQGLNKYIKNHVLVSNNYKDYRADIFTVATELDHSHKVVFSKHDYPSPAHDPTTSYYAGFPIAETVAASMSVPPFYSPYPIRNNNTDRIDYYIDGEIRETLSTDVAIDNECDVVISSWTHTPYHYQQEIGSLINYGLPAICTQAIFLMVQKKILTARDRHRNAGEVIDVVDDYMKTNKFSSEQRKNLLDILEKKLNFRRETRLIDIYPGHEDIRVFFKNPFSLDPKKTSDIVSLAYQKTLDTFALSV